MYDRETASDNESFAMDRDPFLPDHGLCGAVPRGQQARPQAEPPIPQECSPIALMDGDVWADSDYLARPSRGYGT